MAENISKDMLEAIDGWKLASKYFGPETATAFPHSPALDSSKTEETLPHRCYKIKPQVVTHLTGEHLMKLDCGKFQSI